MHNYSNQINQSISLYKMASLMIPCLTEITENKRWPILVCLLINQHLRSLDRIVVNTHNSILYDVETNNDSKAIAMHQNVDTDARSSCLCRTVSCSTRSVE